MKATVKKVEPIIISIPRETPYLGALEENNRPNAKGYFIRPGNKSVYHLHDQSLLVKITLTDGTVGWGECVAFYAPEVGAALVRELVGPLVTGRSPLHVVEIYEDLYNAMRVRGFFGGYYHDVLAAVDIALWDCKGKMLGLPVCEVLGGKRSDKIPAYVSGLPKPTVEERVDLARRWMEDGFDAVKFAAAVSSEGIQKEMKQLREGIGNKPKILVDMHWKYTAAEAVSLITKLEKYDLFVAEAPVKPEDITGQAFVASHVHTQIGIGEELRTVYEFLPRFLRTCMHTIQPEMGRTGITSFWKICQLAQTFGVQVMPHASIGIGIFQAASLHVSALLDNLEYHEYQHSIFDKNLRYLKTTMNCKHGFFTLPEGAGIGAEPDEAVFKLEKK
jgi:L-alanine-DL-glutamate epimerase-like enolase superfamily enzyme